MHNLRRVHTRKATRCPNRHPRPSRPSTRPSQRRRHHAARAPVLTRKARRPPWIKPSCRAATWRSLHLPASEGLPCLPWRALRWDAATAAAKLWLRDPPARRHHLTAWHWPRSHPACCSGRRGSSVSAVDRNRRSWTSRRLTLRWRWRWRWCLSACRSLGRLSPVLAWNKRRHLRLYGLHCSHRTHRSSTGCSLFALHLVILPIFALAFCRAVKGAPTSCAPKVCRFAANACACWRFNHIGRRTACSSRPVGASLAAGSSRGAIVATRPCTVPSNRRNRRPLLCCPCCWLCGCPCWQSCWRPADIACMIPRHLWRGRPFRRCSSSRTAATNGRHHRLGTQARRRRSLFRYLCGKRIVVLNG